MSNDTEGVTIRVLLDGEPHDIPLEKLTLMFHEGGVDVQVDDPSVMEITPEQTVACARGLTDDDWQVLRLNPLFKACYGAIWTERPLPGGLSNAAQSVLHTVGLIVLIRRALIEGRHPFIRWPETYLHPRQQSGLGDMLRIISTLPPTEPEEEQA